MINDCLDNSAGLDAMEMRNDQSRSVFIRQCLHAGVPHLIINISSLIFVGVNLELEFEPIRIGSIYILSAITGSIVAALSLQNRPSVAFSSALFGLLGAAISVLIQNWKVYSKKFATLTAFLIILMLNFIILGKMPCVNNFPCIGGFISGFLSGFILLNKPKLKLDIPVLRSSFLAIFTLLSPGHQILSLVPLCSLKVVGLQY